MFFPVRTDRRLDTTPWVNYALIGMNIGVFVLLGGQQAQIEAGFSRFWLNPLNSTVTQHLTYQFFHASTMHLLGNMLFLYVFGNSVEDRLGHVGYLLFYLAGGVMAGIGHALLSFNPVLGASGSIAAVTGAYLALFPLSNVTIVYWFVVFGAFEVSSMVLILFRIAQDLVFEVAGIGHVAYSAHLAGYVFGFAIGMGLLLSRLLAKEPYDMLTLFEQKRRRSRFKAMTRRGGSPWERDAGRRTSRGSDDEADNGDPAPASPQQQRLMEERSAISAALAQHRTDDAARLYADLLERHGDQVMSQAQQLDLANQLMAESKHELAARAYELLLKAYPQYSQRHHVKLVLGLIYARYLGQQQRASELLKQAEPALHGDDKVLARQVLDELPASA